MSLINDALKRARDAERNRPPAAPHPPLAPVDAPQRQHPAVRWLLLTLVVGIILLSAVSFWKWAHYEPDTTLSQHPFPATRDPQSLPGPYPASTQPDPLDLAHVPTVPPPAPGQPAEPAEVAGPDPSGLLPAAAKPNTVPAPEPGTMPREHADPAVASQPTVPPSEPPPIADPAPELRLQSIIYRLRNPAVVINGEMLHEGDPIAGGTVTEIQRHAVTVQRGASNIVLQLPRL